MCLSRNKSLNLEDISYLCDLVIQGYAIPFRKSFDSTNNMQSRDFYFWGGAQNNCTSEHD